MRYAILVLAIFICCAEARGAVVGQPVEYKIGDATFAGYLAFDNAMSGKRPGILVFPEWWGLNDYPRKRAEQLASMGFVVLAADMYGKGQVATTRDEAARLAAPLRQDRALVRRRARAALEFLSTHPLVDRTNMAAIGFCLGGMVALELARSGADIDGVVAFHANLDTPNPDDAKNIKARILVLHGADDPNVPAQQIMAFEDEMRRANVDWQLNLYGGTVHSFTNPAAGSDPSRGAAYNEKSARRAWEAMRQFFDELFDRGVMRTAFA